MVTGAPPPGGMHAPAPGGPRVPPPGGMIVANEHLRRQLAGYPDAQMTSPDMSGPRAAISRTILPRPGRTTVSTYAWTLPTKPGGSTATLSGASTATAGLTPDMAGVYVLQCVVTFADGVQVTRQVSYTSA